MTHRIAVIGTGFTPTGQRSPPSEIAAIMSSGFSAELIETRMSLFPGTPFERGLGAIGYIEAGIRAQDEGFDAVFINTVGDYGIDELKSALRIPVVGAGEAAMTMATMLGRRFAVVTIWPTSLNFIYDERVRNCGMSARCLGVFNVLSESEMAPRGSEVDPVHDMRAGKAAMLDRIVAAADRAVAAGADTIVLGCTCMAPIGHLIAARMGVPVVEAMTAGYRFAEMLLAMRLRQSPAAYPPVDAGRLAVARKLVNGGDGAPPTELECETCVAAAE
jgi:allantoin racemase